MITRERLAILAAFALMPGFAFPQGGGKAKVEVVGLHVSKPAYKDDKDLASGMDPSPLRVNLLVVMDDPGIIKIDESKCKISKFSDDKGTDLLAKKAGKDDGFGSMSPIGPFTKVSKDQKACVVDVHGRSPPAPGSKGLQLEGTLAVVVGKGQEVAKQEKVEVKKGASFKVGTVGFSIESAGKPDFGDAAMQLTLTTKEGAKIAKLRFLDGAGKEIESSSSGSNSMSFGGETSHSWSYDLKQDAKVLTVEATIWKQVTTVDVPVKLSLSVGF